MHDDRWKVALSRTLVIYLAGWFVYSPLERFVMNFESVLVIDSTLPHQALIIPDSQLYFGEQCLLLMPRIMLYQ